MHAARVVVGIVIVVVVVVVVVASGWLDDRAKPGTTGRTPVVSTEAP